MEEWLGRSILLWLPAIGLACRDAQGNVLAVYREMGGSGSPLYFREHHIYGSIRPGVVQRGQNAHQPKGVSESIPWLGTAYTYTYARGKKVYGLGNHLGNVLATISDRKIGVPPASNSSLIDHYAADVLSRQEYYPFGMRLDCKVKLNKAM